LIFFQKFYFQMSRFVVLSSHVYDFSAL